jgi:WD40 repeat protein
MRRQLWLSAPVRVSALALLLLGFTFSFAADDALPPGVISVLKGHTEAVYAVAFTPDGKYVVTASFDKTLKVWETDTGKEFKTFGGTAGHQNLVLCVAISPDGTLVASGSSDNTAKLWDFPTNKPLREFVQTDSVNAVALSPDGARIAGAGKDGTVKVWTTADGKEAFSLPGHGGGATGVAFSVNGQLLVTSAADKMLRFWNPANGQPLVGLGAHTAPITSVAINPNNTAVYTAGEDGLLKFWTVPPVASRPLAGGPHGDAATCVALSADGNTILSGSADKTVRLSNFATGQTTKALAAPAPVLSTALAPNGATVAAGTANNRLILWNAADGKTVGDVVAHGGPVNGVAFHPQATQLLTAGGDGLLKQWALPFVPARSLAHPDAVASVFATSDGKRLLTGGQDKIVRSWNLANPAQPERQFTGHTAPVTAVVLSPNGQSLVSAGEDATIRFWNQTNSQMTELLGAHAAAITALSFNPNGQQLLSSSADGALKLWQLPAVTPKPFVHPDQVTSAVLAPDGNRLITGCADKQVRLWNLTNGQVERTFPPLTLAVNAVAISANGNSIAAGGADKTLTVWNAADGKEVKKFALNAAVQSVAFSSDGNFVAGGLADNSIHVFDVAMGKETKALTGHTGAVTGLHFTTKGDQLIAASADKTIQVWNIADGTSKAKLDHGAAIHCLALSKDGAKIASGGADKSVKVWTLADSKLAATIPTTGEVRGVSFNADDSRIAVGGADNRAAIYGMDGKMVEFFPHEGAVLAVAFHGDGKRVLTASADKTARQWTTTLLWQANHAGPVRAASFSPKGDRIVSVGDDKTLQVWNPADGKNLKSVTAHEGAVVGLALNVDGTKAVTTGADKKLKVWNLVAAPAVVEDKPVVIALPGAASAAAISPNGVRVAASITDGSGTALRVFDVASGKEMLNLADHTGAIRSLAFLADNRTLVTASADKTAKLLDMNVLAVIDAHAGGVTGVAFHSNGTQALSGGADKTVKLWDLATGKAAKTFGPLPDAISSVAFNRDFTQVGATAGKTVKAWNLADNTEVLTLTHPAEVASVSFSVDKMKIATAGADHLVRVWDVATRQELQWFPHTDAVKSVVFHANNTNIVSASADKTVSIHTIGATRVIPVGAPIRALAVMPNGSHVLTAGDDKKVRLWNVQTGAAEPRMLEGSEKPLRAVAVSKNNVLVAAGGDDQTVRLYTFADGKLLASFKTPGAVRGLAFSPNNATLIAACADKSIASWNVVFNAGQPLPPNFGKALTTYNHGASANDVTFAPDSATFYSGSADKSIKMWKFASEAPVKNFPHPNLVDAVAFNNTGALLATGCHDGHVRIFELGKGALQKDINAHPGMPPAGPAAVYCLAWTPDGKQIVSGSLDHSLKLWDATSGTLVREFKAYKEKEFEKGHRDAIYALSGTLVREFKAYKEKEFEKGHRDAIYALAFSNDGKFLATGSSDRTIKIWNVADGIVVRELVNPNLKPPAAPLLPPSHPGHVYGVRFTSDDKHLISVGGAPAGKGFLGVWNVEDGKLLVSQEMPGGTCYSVALSPDGTKLAIGTGGVRSGGEDVNHSYVIKMPEVK